MAKKDGVKRRPLRLYLIKKSVKTFKEALRDNLKLQSFDLKPSLGLVGKFYLRPAAPVPVDWFDFVQSGVATPLPAITTTPNAAVLFLEVEKRHVALVFGTGRYLIKDTCYESDFGLLSTLNVVDPETLRSLDVFSFQEMVVQKRVQTSRSTNLSAFAVDVSRERFQAVTGLAKDTDLGGRVTGKEGGFGVSASVEFPDLAEQCKKFIKAYASKRYQASFPRTDDFNAVTDAATLKDLNGTLVKRLATNKLSGIHLSPPELIEYEEFDGFSFTPKGDIKDELLIEDYIAAQSDPSKLTIDDVKRHRVFARLQTDPEPLSKWTVFRCLVCEIKKGKNVFVLWGGRWCRVAAAFADRVLDYVKTIEDCTLPLPSPSTNILEGDWLNEAVASSSDIALMDQKFVWCDNAGSKIEVCDLFSLDRHLIHAKRKKYGAMGFSHLFMQGKNAAEALVRDASFRDGARQHLDAVAKKFGKKIPKERPKAGQFKVVYAPMGKPKGRFVETLPFFSKLTLMQVTEDLRALGIEVSIADIETPE